MREGEPAKPSHPDAEQHVPVHVDGVSPITEGFREASVQQAPQEVSLVGCTTASREEAHLEHPDHHDDVQKESDGHSNG